MTWMAEIFKLMRDDIQTDLFFNGYQLERNADLARLFISSNPVVVARFLSCQKRKSSIYPFLHLHQSYRVILLGVKQGRTRDVSRCASNPLSSCPIHPSLSDCWAVGGTEKLHCPTCILFTKKGVCRRGSQSVIFFFVFLVSSGCLSDFEWAPSFLYITKPHQLSQCTMFHV